MKSKQFKQSYPISFQHFRHYIYFIVLLIISFGMMSFSREKKVNNSYYFNLGDTTITDTIAVVSGISVSLDSSKLFANLLSSSPASRNSVFDVSVNPQAKLFVDDFLRKHGQSFNSMKIWGKPYFDLYDRILGSYGVPVELKYLSVIESSLACRAVSCAGALGPWQIMTDAAHEHGLKTGRYDDRLDYIKSTNAAAQILRELYKRYGDWLLVIAAYNAGPGGVDRAISRGHSRNFWNIQYYLPEETRNHVKKFIATHYYFERDQEGQSSIFNNIVNSDNLYSSMIVNSATINIYGKYNSVVIANALMIDIALFNQLNPDFDKMLAEGGIYPLRIPSEKVELFQSRKIEILKQSVELLLTSSSSSGTR